jgi:hypothetical protein
MTKLWLTLALLLLPVLADAQPTVSFGPPGQTSVPMTTTWAPVPGAASYVLNGAYNDNTGFFSASGALSPLTRPMPYHASGAATPGWTCVTVTGAAEGSCTGFTVPAKPVLAGSTSLRTANYREPVSTNLSIIRLYYTLNGVAQPTVTFPASSPTGGATRVQTFTVASDQGTLVAYTTAVTATGSESPRDTSTLVFKPPITAPAKGAVGVTTITK